MVGVQSAKTVKIMRLENLALYGIIINDNYSLVTCLHCVSYGAGYLCSRKSLEGTCIP